MFVIKGKCIVERKVCSELQQISEVAVTHSAPQASPIQTPHHHYHCTLPADNAEDWITGWIPPWVTWYSTNRKTFFSPLKSESLELLHIHSLSCHILPVLPSLFAPLYDSHGRFPVFVRRPSSQSAVKAVILLVAIYYPVVRLKKDWKRAKLGAGCWVSRHAKLQSESTTDLYTCLSAYGSACFSTGVLLLSQYVLLLTWWSVHLFVYRVFHSAAGSARWHFLLPLRAGMCWFANFEDNKAAWGGCV